MAWENLGQDILEDVESVQEVGYVRVKFASGTLTQMDRETRAEGALLKALDKRRLDHNEVARVSMARKRAKDRHEDKHGEVSAIAKQQLLMQSLERQARRRAKVKKAEAIK